MAYIYIHKRKTDGSVFYVGKGTGRRAWFRWNRSDWWHNVVNKHGFTWEIIHNGLTEDCAYDKEIEVIKEYRSNGIKLVNLTLGGDGNTSGLASEFPELYPKPYLNVIELRDSLPDWWHKGCGL